MPRYGGSAAVPMALFIDSRVVQRFGSRKQGLIVGNLIRRTQGFPNGGNLAPQKQRRYQKSIPSIFILHWIKKLVETGDPTDSSTRCAGFSSFWRSSFSCFPF
jgi:hypothetical protein